MAELSSTPVVGIDLGTTFSVVAYLDAQGRAVTLPNSEGDLTTPSVAYFDKAGVVVGKEAVKSAEFEPDRVAPYPKRDMGSEFYHRPIRGLVYRPEVLQALVLQKLKADAELQLGPLSKCVITVPAYFNEPRRKATQDAGRMAGWDVIDIINEPTAAAIAYGVHRGFLSPTGEAAQPETILVYDLGGGTFDVTIMRVERNCFTTLATAGDVELGGIDWDDRIGDIVAERLMAERLMAERGDDPRKDPAAAIRLRREAEDAKRSLSTKQETVIAFAHEGHRLRTTLTRADFEARTGDLVDRTIMTIRKLMREAKLTYADLTRLLVVGGSSRMPMVREALERETGFTIDAPLPVDEAVASGAAVYARYVQEKASGQAGFRVRNVNSHTLGVLGIEAATKLRRRKVMIARNTPLPAEFTQRFMTADAGQKSVVVTVIEGGDDAGNHSTLIGRCILAGLAQALPPRAKVDVTFSYSDDGRLTVRAFLPDVNRESLLTIERAQGMSAELIDAWAKAIAGGLPDGCTLPEVRKAESAGDANAAGTGPTPQANPLNATEMKRMPRQVDETSDESANSTEPTVALTGEAETIVAPAKAATPAAKRQSPAKPPESVKKPAEPAKKPEPAKPTVMEKPVVAEKPATVAKPPVEKPTVIEKPPIVAVETPPSTPPVTSLPAVGDAPTFEVEVPIIGEPIAEVSDGVEAFSVDTARRRKKKKKPPESPASADDDAKAKKKPAWKFW